MRHILPQKFKMRCHRKISFKNFVQVNHTIFVWHKLSFDKIVQFLIFLLQNVPIGSIFEFEIRVSIRKLVQIEQTLVKHQLSVELFFCVFSICRKKLFSRLFFRHSFSRKKNNIHRKNKLCTCTWWPWNMCCIWERPFEKTKDIFVYVRNSQGLHKQSTQNSISEYEASLLLSIGF